MQALRICSQIERGESFVSVHDPFNTCCLGSGCRVGRADWSTLGYGWGREATTQSSLLPPKPLSELLNIQKKK